MEGIELIGDIAVLGSWQADVCHAYQILRKGGLKEENIVVFMYDDIAHNILNPRPGVIINHPKGENVYTGVPKVLLVLSALYFYSQTILQVTIKMKKNILVCIFVLCYHICIVVS